MYFSQTLQFPSKVPIPTLAPSKYPQWLFHFTSNFYSFFPCTSILPCQYGAFLLSRVIFEQLWQNSSKKKFSQQSFYLFSGSQLDNHTYCWLLILLAQASPSRTAPFSREGVRPYQDHFLHNNFPQGQQLGSFPAGPESRSANTQEMCLEPLQILLSPQNFTQTPTFRYPCLSCVSVFPLWSVVN